MADKQHLRLILNGKAAGNETVRSEVLRLREKGHRVSVRVTWEDGDAERYTREALAQATEEKITTLVAGGGDGTLNAVVTTALSDGEVGQLPFSLAVVPLGTANDFARGIGLDPKNLRDCFAVAAGSKAKPTDVGQVNDRYFINMATAGFGAKLTVETQPMLKNLLGGAAYLLTGLTRFSELSNSTACVMAEDDFEFEGDFIALAIGNGKRAGGGVDLCPDAELDDGLLNLSIIPTSLTEEVKDILSDLLEQGAEAVRARAVRHKSKGFTIKSDEPLQVNLDGEPMTANEVTVKVLTNAVCFRRP